MSRAAPDGRLAGLVSLLDRYSPPPSEAQFHIQMMDLARSQCSSLGRNQFVPGHFTASAFLVHERQVLLVHHRRLDIWVQPGGHIDPGDRDVLAAAMREATEETGLEGFVTDGEVFDIDVHAVPGRSPEPNHAHFDVRFLFAVPSAEPVPGSAEIIAARWVHFDHVASLTTDASVLRAVEKLRGAAPG